MKSPREFKLVSDPERADPDNVCVTLFRGTHGVCGWYLSPVRSALAPDRYVPRSAELIASSAVLRAAAVAATLGVQVCIVDPDDLWMEAWGGSKD